MMPPTAAAEPFLNNYMSRVRASVPDSPKLSIIVPFYNEEENITRMHAAIVAAVEPMQVSFEMVLVDDGSKDSTAQLATELARRDPRVVFVKFRRNYGRLRRWLPASPMRRGRSSSRWTATCRTIRAT
jgi:cellulose synthase/poly-beta-1,6-N-acetylglucosamine synthase-like glycosyltransferase